MRTDHSDNRHYHLFPETVGDVLSESIIGRAQERGYVRINCHQLRDYTKNRQKQVDDYPYGGGKGMILQADPLYNCWEHICKTAGGPVYTVLMSAQGNTFRQRDALRLRDKGRLILVCGHYEGVMSVLSKNVMRKFRWVTSS